MTPRSIVLGLVVEIVITPDPPPPLVACGKDGFESNGDAVLAPEMLKATTSPYSGVQNDTVI
jgi:hypothetical protein